MTNTSNPPIPSSLIALLEAAQLNIDLEEFRAAESKIDEAITLIRAHPTPDREGLIEKLVGAAHTEVFHGRGAQRSIALDKAIYIIRQYDAEQIPGDASIRKDEGSRADAPVITSPVAPSEIPIVKQSLTLDAAEAFRVINALWMLLDDIDTLDDAAKDDDTGFRQSCYAIQQKRWQIYNLEDPGSICKTPTMPVSLKEVYANAPDDLHDHDYMQTIKAVLDAAGVKYVD